MFRKSVSFFILVALLWVLLWVYIPDASPGHFTISDFFKGFLLLFSFMAFGFALLILTIRYKGLEIATHFVPHAGIVMWLGKHAYEYSQPKTILHLTYLGTEATTFLTITTGLNTLNDQLDKGITQLINLGLINSDPELSWGRYDQQNNTQVLSIEHLLRKIGRNLQVDVTIDDKQAHFKIR